MMAARKRQSDSPAERLAALLRASWIRVYASHRPDETKASWPELAAPAAGMYREIAGDLLKAGVVMPLEGKP